MRKEPAPRFLSMTEFRREPGERITDIVRDRQSFVITKAGKPVAVLCPLDMADLPNVATKDGDIHGTLATPKRSRRGR